MSEGTHRFSFEPRLLKLEELEGISDPYEKQFALYAHRAGFEVREAGMITLNRVKREKQDKLSTYPDFLVNGVFVEITKGENLGGRKAGQKRVMEEAGLPYVQLTGQQVAGLSEKSNLRDAITELLTPSYSEE